MVAERRNGPMQAMDTRSRQFVMLTDTVDAAADGVQATVNLPRLARDGLKRCLQLRYHYRHCPTAGSVFVRVLLPKLTVVIDDCRTLTQISFLSKSTLSMSVREFLSDVDRGGQAGLGISTFSPFTVAAKLAISFGGATDGHLQ